MLANGEVQELRVDPSAPPAPFARGKVRLRALDEVGSSTVTLKECKPSAGRSLQARKLAVIVHKCFAGNAQSLVSTVISKAAVNGRPIFAQLDANLSVATGSELSRHGNRNPSQRRTLRDRISWNVNINNSHLMIRITKRRPQFPHFRADEAYARFFTRTGAMILVESPSSSRRSTLAVDWTHPDLQAQYVDAHFGAVGN